MAERNCTPPYPGRTRPARADAWCRHLLCAAPCQLGHPHAASPWSTTPRAHHPPVTHHPGRSHRISTSRTKAHKGSLARGWSGYRRAVFSRSAEIRHLSWPYTGQRRGPPASRRSAGWLARLPPAEALAPGSSSSAEALCLLNKDWRPAWPLSLRLPPPGGGYLFSRGSQYGAEAVEIEIGELGE